MKQIKLIDLFSGCGGMSLGFQNAGFKIISAYDNWQPAVDVYKENFNHPIYNKDLSDVSIIDELKEFILWCKKEGVKSFKNTDVEFHLSDLAIISSAQIVEGKDSDLLERVRIEK
jgi:site-specific DNA-cytosine methylase